MKEILPVRKRIRIKNYDYTKENIYFITICTKDRLELLGKIGSENYIKLSQEGKIAKDNIDNIDNIEEIYDNAKIHEHIIMPNHIHILLEIKNKKKTTISKIIKHYKTNVSKEITYSIWQKSFYEHIVRNEKEYLKIKEYIKSNIINWNKDKYF